MKFRKKPVVIEAVQYAPDTSTPELLAFLEGCTGWHTGEGGIVIPTLEGSHLARPGDWIIKGVKGEFYPCKPDIFAATYEPAPVHAVAETHKFRRSGIVGDLWCGTCGNGPTHPVHAVEPPAPEKRCTCKAGGLGGHWLGCPVLDPPAAPQDEKPKGGE